MIQTKSKKNSPKEIREKKLDPPKRWPKPPPQQPARNPNGENTQNQSDRRSE